MSDNDPTKSCHLHVTAATGQLPLNISVVELESCDGLVWFEPAPGTRVGEYDNGFHPLLRDARCDLPDIDLLELRHFRPDGVAIWQAGKDIVRCSVIDEVDDCTEENGSGCCPEVHRIDKQVLPRDFKRFTGKLDFETGAKLTLIEYWLKGRRIAWTLTKKEV